MESRYVNDCRERQHLDLVYGCIAAHVINFVIST